MPHYLLPSLVLAAWVTLVCLIWNLRRRASQLPLFNDLAELRTPASHARRRGFSRGRYPARICAPSPPVGLHLFARPCRGRRRGRRRSPPA